MVAGVIVTVSGENMFDSSPRESIPCEMGETVPNTKR